ncbi:MAG TPA: hypothetical protein VFF67_06905 [Thermoplasmata archaeon]|nr:hypothetical protein [Thermoplasmata archaeon]
MALVADWGNLAIVALPVITSLGVSGLLAILLYRVGVATGVPHRRERCLRCVFASALHSSGTCDERCAVNELPRIPALLLWVTGTFALLFLLFPSTAFAYVLPLELRSPALFPTLAGFLGAANLGGMIVLAAYLLQDRAWSRELFNRVGAGGSIVGLLLGFVSGGMIRSVTLWFTPAALTVLLVGLGLEYRARSGRPTMGLRAIGTATAPLFLTLVVGAVRIVQIVALAHV